MNTTVSPDWSAIWQSSESSITALLLIMERLATALEGQAVWDRAGSKAEAGS